MNNKENIQQKKGEFENSFNIKSIEESLLMIIGNFASDFKNAMIAKYKLPEEEINDLIKDCIVRRTSSPEIILGKISIKKENKFLDPDTGKYIEKPGCEFILIRGPRAGTPCGKSRTKDIPYCSIHEKKMPKKLLNDIEFKQEKDSEDLFRIPGTGLIVTRNDYSIPVSKNNCEIVGYIDPVEDIQGKGEISKNIPEKHLKYAREKGIKLADYI
jgi:hypothetical protein